MHQTGRAATRGGFPYDKILTDKRLLLFLDCYVIGDALQKRVRVFGISYPGVFWAKVPTIIRDLVMRRLAVSLVQQCNLEAQPFNKLVNAGWGR
jgi:hypothetical protein